MTKEQEAILNELLSKRGNLSEEDKSTLTDLLEATRKMAELHENEKTKSLATKEEIESMRSTIHTIEDLLKDNRKNVNGNEDETELKKSCRALFDAIQK